MSFRLKTQACAAVGLLDFVVGCSGTPREPVESPQPYAVLNPGCERVRLMEPHHSVPYEVRVLQNVSVSWSDRGRDLRSLLINEACRAGAEAVVQVLETVESDDSGLPIYKIGGVAVTFDRQRPHAGPLTLPQPVTATSDGLHESSSAQSP